LIPNKKQKVEHIVKMIDMPQVLQHKPKGPRANLERMQIAAMRPDEQATWFEQARIAAILGSSSRALPSVRSGLRCYFGFAGHAMYWQTLHEPCFVLKGIREKEPGLPPKLETLLAWSCLFRSAGTFQNYVGYLKTACMLVGAPVKACSVLIRFSASMYQICE